MSELLRVAVNPITIGDAVSIVALSAAYAPPVRNVMAGGTGLCSSTHAVRPMMSSDVIRARIILIKAVKYNK